MMNTNTTTLNQEQHPSVNQQVMNVINQYVKGTEFFDSTILDKAFHEKFRVVAMTQDGLRVINKQEYLSLIKAEKIGGNKRELEVLNVIESDTIMQISLTLSNEKQVFHDHLALIKENDYWEILHNTTHVTGRNKD